MKTNTNNNNETMARLRVKTAIKAGLLPAV